MKFKKMLFFIVILFLSREAFSQPISTPKQVSFGTSYPSPVGVYKKLRLYPNDVIDPTLSCNNVTEEGTMYYDLSAHQMYICSNGAWGSLGGGVWTQTGTNIYPSDPDRNNIKIGIGTTAPLMNLHVKTGRGADTMTIENSNPVGYATINFRGEDGQIKGKVGFGNSTTQNQEVRNRMMIQSSTGTDLMLATNNFVGVSSVPRIMIKDTTGYVGIGTIDPAAKLDVAGSAILGTIPGVVGSSSLNNPIFQIKRGSDGVLNLLEIKNTDDASQVVELISSRDGATSVSTPLPSSWGGGILDLNSYTPNTEQFINFGNNTGNKWVLGMEDADDAGDNHFDIAEIKGDGSFNPRIWIQKGSGNIGIGTTNPISELHVKYSIPQSTQLTVEGPSGFESELSLERSNHTVGWELERTGTDDFRIFQLGLNETRLFIGTDGDVGIGTSTPGYALQILTSQPREVMVMENRDTAGYAGVSFRGSDGAQKGSVGFGNPISSNLDRRNRMMLQSNAGIGGNPGTDLVLATNNIPGVSSIPRIMIKDVPFGVGIGNIGIGTITPSYTLDVNGTLHAIGITDSSDVRLKEDITTIKGALDRVLKLRGVNYHWKDKKNGKELQMGLIAQEVEPVFPEVVSTDNEGYKSIAYDKLVGALVEAIKELKSEVDLLKEENKRLKEDMRSLRKEN